MFLSRLLAGVPAGRYTKWLVVVVWVAAVAALSPMAGRVGEIEENDPTAFLSESAESTRVYELQSQFEQGQDPPAIVVYAREDGITTADRDAIEQDRQALDGLQYTGQVAPAVPSQDGNALLLVVPFESGGDEDLLSNFVEAVRAEVDTGTPEGLTARVTGPAGQIYDEVQVFQGLDLTLLLAAAGVVAVLLLIIYRSPVLWLIPVVTAVLAIQVSNAAVYLLAEYAGVTVNGQSSGILPVLVFGVGTDYALLLIARYREELHREEDKHRAMAVALRRAGPAILGAAATGIVALLCLLAAEMTSNRGLGPISAAGIACAFVAMLTLLPALLVIFGRRLFWPFIPRFGTPSPEERDNTVWGLVGRVVGRWPRVTWVATTMLLGALALGMLTGLETGLAAEDRFTDTPEAVEGQQLVAEHYPAGRSDPAVIIADVSTGEAVIQAAANVQGVAEIQESARSDGLINIPAVLSDPPSSGEAERTIERLRDAVHAVPEANALVGGTTAINLDTANAAEHDRNLVIPLAIGVVFVILVLLLRSLIAPLLLTATVVLSFLTAVGGSWLVFDQVFGFEGVYHSLVLLGFVFLVALGIDYNIFLMTRVREEVARSGHRHGVLHGLAVTGGVITSAGLVLAATFAVLTILPLVWMIEFGFLVAFGVLLDTFIVRSILVPALALDVGPGTWWPGRLSKRTSPASSRVSTPEPSPSAPRR